MFGGRAGVVPSEIEPAVDEAAASDSHSLRESLCSQPPDEDEAPAPLFSSAERPRAATDPDMGRARGTSDPATSVQSQQAAAHAAGISPGGRKRGHRRGASDGAAYVTHLRPHGQQQGQQQQQASPERSAFQKQMTFYAFEALQAPMPARPVPKNMMIRSVAELEAEGVQRTTWEVCRDAVQRVLEHRFFAWVGIFWILWVVGDGGFFFFMMIGADTIEPVAAHNWWLNASIHCLNVLFTYSHLVSTPWRVANLEHLHTTRRDSAPGLDWYGLPTDAIWFHIPRRPRVAILVLLCLGGLCQFANQAMRVLYPTYEASNAWPGNLLCNVFFASSFAFGISGGVYQVINEGRLRRQDTELVFEPGPVEVAQYIRDEVRGGAKATNLVLSMIKDKEGFDQAMLTSRRESVATARDTATTASASSLAAPAGAPAAVAPRSSPLSPRGNTA